MLENFFAPRLTELGKIKIGGKGQERAKRDGSGTYRQPEKHDHFTITTMHRTPAGDLLPDEGLMRQLVEAYGDTDKKLRQIPIRVLSDNPEDIMQSAYVWYGNRSVGARSDGKRVTWFYDPKTFARFDPPKEEDWKPEMLELVDRRNAKLFKLHTTFNCVIAVKEARWGGVYKFRTTSVISGNQLYGSLVETARLTNGILIGMPLMLVVRPIVVSPEGKATTVYVVHVELRGADMKAIQDAARDQMRYQIEFKSEMERGKAQYRKMLVAPGQESGDEAGDIQEEFSPETAGERVEPEAPTTVSLLAKVIDGEVIDEKVNAELMALADSCGKDAVNA